MYHSGILDKFKIKKEKHHMSNSLDTDQLKNKLSESSTDDNSSTFSNYDSDFKPLSPSHSMVPEGNHRSERFFKTRKNSIDDELEEEFKNRRNVRVWVNDESIKNCQNTTCNIEFSWYYRKHHCRACGRIFCYNCSNKQMYLPKELEQFPDHADALKFSTSFNSWLAGTTMEKERVCNKCHAKYTKLNDVRKYIDIFLILELDIKVLHTLTCVSKTWKTASSYCINKFKNIQYCIPQHKYSKIERRLLINNCKYFSSHSIWMTQILKILDPTNKSKVEKFFKQISKKKKRTSCWNLMCSRYCKNHITPHAALDILHINSRPIRLYALKCLNRATIEELRCYLPILVEYVKYDLNDELISNFLIQKSLEHRNIRIEVYWLLTLKTEDKTYGSHFMFIRSNFTKVILEKMGKQQIDEITNGKKMVSMFQKTYDIWNLEQMKEKISETITINKLFDEPITMPINSDIKCKKILVDSINIKDSATKPILIPCVQEDGAPYKVLFKNEDLRVDYIIMKIIKLMDIILKKEQGLDLGILTYNILPTSSQDGFIEIVPDSETIYHIKTKMGYSILNYIMDNNKNKTVEIIRNNFMKSTAAYCVITYLLGIGDRHLDNIMINRNGLLFHIDFSFILGSDPKLINPIMRITPEMVDALGGINSAYYKEFSSVCSQIYNCLRRHVNLFTNLLLLIVESSPKSATNITRETMRKEISQRFLPGHNFQEAELHICNKVRNSGDYYSPLIDFLYHHNKQNTIKESIKGVASGALEMGSNLMKMVYESTSGINLAQLQKQQDFHDKKDEERDQRKLSISLEIDSPKLGPLTSLTPKEKPPIHPVLSSSTTSPLDQTEHNQIYLDMKQKIEEFDQKVQEFQNEQDQTTDQTTDQTNKIEDVEGDDKEHEELDIELLKSIVSGESLTVKNQKQKEPQEIKASYYGGQPTIIDDFEHL
jgi:hypothetical protein